MKDYCAKNVNDRYCLQDDFVSGDDCSGCSYAPSRVGKMRIITIKPQGRGPIPESNTLTQDLRMSQWDGASPARREFARRRRELESISSLSDFSKEDDNS